MNTGIFEPTIWVWLFGPGIGTNIGASLVWVVIAGAAATLLWPPLRKRIHRFMDRKLAPIHEHLTTLRAHAEHQTKVVEDHFKATTGHAHPDAGKLDKSDNLRSHRL